MKRCPYCGAAYHDDVPVCAIDRTPLVSESPEPISSRFAHAVDTLVRFGAERPVTDLLLAGMIGLLFVVMVGYVSFIRL